MHPDSPHRYTQWARHVWSNKFLFIAVLVGFITIFPVLYIPVINDAVFKHTGITWEWIVVLIESLLFFAGIETYKFGKRAFLRRRQAKATGGGDDPENRIFQRYLTDSSLGEKSSGGK